MYSSHCSVCTYFNHTRLFSGDSAYYCLIELLMYTASNTLIYSILIIIQLRKQRCGLAHILSVETNVCSVRIFDMLQE